MIKPTGTKIFCGLAASFCLTTISLHAQSLLTPEQAVSLALQNNYSLLLAHDETAEASVNRQAAVGSFLPTADAFITRSGTTDSSFSANQTTVGASLNWVIFDGFQSYNQYRFQKSTEKSVMLQERLTIETTLESVLDAYYTVVLQKQQLKTLEELVTVAGNQAQLANSKLSVGAGSQLDVLTARATLLSDSTSLLSQQITLRQSEIQLNQLLSRDPSLEFEVIDTLPIENDLPVAAMRTSLDESNSAIQVAKFQRDALNSNLQEAKGLWLPTLSAGVNYNVSPAALNPSYVPVGGKNATYNASLVFPIPFFDQFKSYQATGDARWQLRQGDLKLKQQELAILGEFDQNNQKYTSGLQLVSLAENNLEVSRQQMNAANEQYKAGIATELQFQTAQSLFLQAEGQLVSARQNAKQAELALKRASGMLMRETPSGNQGN